MKKLKFTKESEFIPFGNLLLEDNEKIKELKSLYKKEEEYMDFLGPIESFIACFYLDNPNMQDIDVIRDIKSIIANYNKDLDFFKLHFERELMGAISFTLSMAKRKITKHELFLVLGYILWSIDNRSWVGDKRAYLNWIVNFFGLFSKSEEKRFKKFYDELGKKLGLSKGKIKVMKNEEFNIKISANEELLNTADSEKFADYSKLFLDSSTFVEEIDSSELNERMKSFHKKHNEEMNFSCKKCNKKISVHNKDWHDGMCDRCFYEYHREE